MIFQADRFTPEFIPDARIRTVLCNVLNRTKALVSPTDIFVETILQPHPSIVESLRVALGGHAPLDHWLQAIQSQTHLSQPRLEGIPSRGSFTPEALSALDEFETKLRS